jgi:REP element-mobilizing transposase RayT
MYHFVFVAKYRRVVVSEEVDVLLKDICLEISKRFEIRFLEIGSDGDHVHFLIQSVPRYSPTEIAKKVKSITAREVFSGIPSVKKKLWGGEFWSEGYYVSSVGEHANEEVIREYINRQGGGADYRELHKAPPVLTQMDLF